MSQSDPTLPYTPEDVDEAFERMATDQFSFFVRGLVIPAASGPVLLEDAMLSYESLGVEPFQRRFFEDVAPSLEAVRIGAEPPCRRFWLERTKKASKDSDLAVCLLWLMAFPRRPTFCQVVAADREQADIIRHRAEDICFYNHWLAERVRFTRGGMASVCGLAETRIEATDKASAHGETPQLLILNELVHVAKWEVMETHYNNAAGVPRGVMIVSTNAGYRGTKADVWKQNASSKPDRWHMHVWHERAPWLKEEDVEDARSINTPSEFARLFGGRWVSGKGEGLTEEAIDGVFRGYLRPMTGKEEGWTFIAGLDMGRSHDHSGLTVVGTNKQEKRIRVAYMRDWRPTVPNDRGVLQIDVASVKKTVVGVYKQFSLVWFGYDPAEGAWQIAQELRVHGVRLCEMPFTGSSLNEMATAFKKAIMILECYESEILRRDLGKFVMRARPPTHYQIKAISDEYGHADVGTGLLICLPKAVELVGGLVPEPSQVFFYDEEDVRSEREETEEAKKADPFLDDILSGVDPFLDDILIGIEEDEEEGRWKKVGKRRTMESGEIDDFFLPL